VRKSTAPWCARAGVPAAFPNAAVRGSRWFGAYLEIRLSASPLVPNMIAANHATEAFQFKRIKFSPLLAPADGDLPERRYLQTMPRKHFSSSESNFHLSLHLQTGTCPSGDTCKLQRETLCAAFLIGAVKTYCLSGGVDKHCRKPCSTAYPLLVHCFSATDVFQMPVRAVPGVPGSAPSSAHPQS
jgi:hypothetical protein